MATVNRPVAGVRELPDTRSELVTQALMGYSISILARKAGWLRCESDDGTAGWVPAGAADLSPEYSPTHFVARRFSRLAGKAGSGPLLSLGSLLRVKGQEGPRSCVVLPDGSAWRIPAGDIRKLGAGAFTPGRFSRLLREVMGTPYLWGGRSAFGFDCSGLVNLVYGLLGVRLPRDSGDQARVGRPVKRLSGLRPFDLVFFGPPARIDHVAIHLGELRIVHASGYVRVESLDRASRLCRPDLIERFHFGRRLVDV
jgi:hypothetical protein